jgi:hypothetical protein
MKKIDVRSLLYSNLESDELASFAADCLDGVECFKHYAGLSFCSNDGINPPIEKCVYSRYFDRYYQTRDDSKNCILRCEFNGKNDAVIIIRHGTKIAKGCDKKLKYHYGEVITAPDTLFGVKMYLICMVPTEAGARICFNYYPDISTIYDAYLEEEKLHLIDRVYINRTFQYAADSALSRFNSIYNSDEIFKELTKCRIEPTEVRVDEVALGKEAEIIRRILIDPWSVIRRFEQIEESKKAKLENSSQSLEEPNLGFEDPGVARKLSKEKPSI